MNLEHFPPIDPSRTAIDAPVRAVTLLEDRAQVRRVARVSSGQRLIVLDVAPVLQDVSLLVRVVNGGVEVADARVGRAMRVRREDRPAVIRALEEEARTLARRFGEIDEDRRRAEEQCLRLLEILRKSADEVPEDAAWGLVHPQAWREGFGSLFDRSRKLRHATLQGYFAQRKIVERVGQIAEEHAALDRPDVRFVAWIEIDLKNTVSSEVELAIEYVVPAAIWRPIHSAKAGGGKLSFTASAAVWQNTGEDWRDVALSFSTARSSLGTEPPLLSDDLLTARKRSDRVQVEARQVAVQNTGQGRGGPGAAPPPSGVDLPGVDDGGDVLVLKAGGPSSIPSDGRPNIVPLFDFEGPAVHRRVLMPELDARVFEVVAATNGANFPILAGPVELIRDHGVVGWTKVLFVAPGERFELSFGPDDELRSARDERRETETDRSDKWRHTTTVVESFLSNLGSAEKVIELIERIPVSEIDEVRVKLVENKTSGKPALDDHGFVKWQLSLAPRARQRIKLVWKLSAAPAVEGL